MCVCVNGFQGNADSGGGHVLVFEGGEPELRYYQSYGSRCSAGHYRCCQRHQRRPPGYQGKIFQRALSIGASAFDAEINQSVAFKSVPQNPMPRCPASCRNAARKPSCSSVSSLNTESGDRRKPLPLPIAIAQAGSRDFGERQFRAYDPLGACPHA